MAACTQHLIELRLFCATLSASICSSSLQTFHKGTCVITVAIFRQLNHISDGVELITRHPGDQENDLFITQTVEHICGSR